MMWTVAITIVLSLYEPDPRLQSYELRQAVQDAEDLVRDVNAYMDNDPSIWWRMTGWGVYIACGSIPVSSMYRQSRSAWEPNGPNNAAIAASIFGSAAMATNVLSEKVRAGMRKSDAAWAARLTMFGACLAEDLWNANQGWRRR